MKTLEGYKAFSYVAWAIIVLFSLFTYGLARNLEKSTDYLETVATERSHSLVEVKND